MESLGGGFNMFQVKPFGRKIPLAPSFCNTPLLMEEIPNNHRVDTKPCKSREKTSTGEFTGFLNPPTVLLSQTPSFWASSTHRPFQMGSAVPAARLR